MRVSEASSRTASEQGTTGGGVGVSSGAGDWAGSSELLEDSLVGVVGGVSRTQEVENAMAIKMRAGSWPVMGIDWGVASCGFHLRDILLT